MSGIRQYIKSLGDPAFKPGSIKPDSIKIGSVSLLALALTLTACSNAPQIAVEPEAPEPPQAAIEIYEPAAKVFKPVYPQKYTVQKGDTLWDISTMFLSDPWVWPEIWHNNTQVQNPHLIYPGDILTIIFIDGKPHIQVAKRGALAPEETTLKVVKLSPKIRQSGIESHISSIPIEAIQQLLIQPRVIDKATLDKAAYILSSPDNRLINGSGDRVFIRGGNHGNTQQFNVFRPSKPLKDTITGEILGYEAIYVGDASLVAKGDPATVLLTRTVREALRGDRLMPYADNEIDRDFFPRPPKNKVEGRVISLFDAISQIGQYQIAVINMGLATGIEVGNLLVIEQAGHTISDKKVSDPSFKIQLPNVRSGTMMIIKAFDKVSYGLMMQATRAIHVDDIAKSP
ncbi:MAG: LysM peptidoglycan-binding domain-containing protein [Gammaproteobacteria bacterium]|nr:LysM peptidoglycan-binding domain-containing protein [Gammaproteobacteria bacterium]